MFRSFFEQRKNKFNFRALYNYLKLYPMLKSLLKTAIRHILKHFGYSILNILGLTLGITSALFLIIYVADEVSYDRYHEKADRIYRVSSKITEPDDQFRGSSKKLRPNHELGSSSKPQDAYGRKFFINEPVQDAM